MGRSSMKPTSDLSVFTTGVITSYTSECRSEDSAHTATTAETKPVKAYTKEAPCRRN